MPKRNRRTVYLDFAGRWVNKRDGLTMASSKHDAQEDAIKAAHEMLQNQGGGELTVKTADGKIQSREMVRADRSRPSNDES